MTYQFRKAAFLTGLIGVLMFVFAGVTTAADYKWPKKYMLGTSGMGSSGYAMNIALASIMESETGMRVRVVPDDNQAVRSKLLKTQAIDVVGGEGAVAASILEASGGYATEDGGPFQLRDHFPSTGAPLSTGFIVRKDSAIKSIWDIEPGVKISNLTAIPDMMKAYKGLLAWVGLEPDDAVFVPFGGYSASIRSVAQGRADIAYALPISSVVLELESSPHGIRWIDMNPNASEKDAEGAKRFQKYLPTFGFAQNQLGVPSAKGWWGMKGMMGKFVHVEADPEFIYHVTKWLIDNYDKLKDKHPGLRSYQQSMMVDAIEKQFIPIHEGTIRYLKEIGHWNERQEKRQQYNLWLVDQYVNAYDGAIKKAKAAGMRINPQNEEWVKLWKSEKADLPVFMIMTDEEIDAAMKKYNIQG